MTREILLSLFLFIISISVIAFGGCGGSGGGGGSGSASCTTDAPCLLRSPTPNIDLENSIANDTIGEVTIQALGGGGGDLVGVGVIVVDEFKTDFTDYTQINEVSGNTIRMALNVGWGVHSGNYVYEVVLLNSANLATLYMYDTSKSNSKYFLTTADMNSMQILSSNVSSIPLALVTGVQAPGTTTYYIETFSNGSGNAADTFLRYLGTVGNGRQAPENDDKRFDPENLYSQMAIALEPGIHNFQVSDPYNVGDYYSIRISTSGFGGSSPGTPTAPDGYEPNDWGDPPTVLTLDFVQDHSLNPTGEFDYFAFTIP